MADQPSSTSSTSIGSIANIANVTTNEGAIVGSISGGTNIFGQVVYTAQDVSLAKAELRRVLESNNFYTPPSNVATVLRQLTEQKLIILYAPSSYGVEFVAEFLPKQLQREKVFYFDSDASGKKLLGILENTDRKTELDGAVVIVSGASAEKYQSVIRSIQEAAAARNTIVILTTTDESGWQTDASKTFVSLPDQGCYAIGDITRWLIKGLESAKERLTLIGALAPAGAALMADDKLIEIEGISTATPTFTTIGDLAARLKDPGRVAAFVAQLRSIGTNDTPQRLGAILESIENVDRERVQDWFNQIREEKVRYFVLALGLLDSLEWGDGLEQETFWAVYEQLTQEAWREREAALSMADYLDLTKELSAYISVDNNRIHFRNRDDQRAILEQALKTHRRALVQALPTLANILIAESRTGLPQADAMAMVRQLNSLDVFGSDLYPTKDFSLRQNQLRDNIALSIARIGKYEPTTTEYLLLSWAEGPGEKASEDSTVRLRLAVSRTLVQMMRLDTSGFFSEDVGAPSRSSLALLKGWYDRFRSGATATSSHLSPERRTSIRSTMVIALAHLGRALRDTPADFGIDKSQPAVLFTPDSTGQPKQSDSLTLWQMLTALAWDPDPAVRGSVAFGIPELMESYPEHAQLLIETLSSDWNTSVRINVARLLVAIIERDPWRSSIVRHLLTLPDFDEGRPEPIRNLEGVSSHYLYSEYAAYKSSSAKAVPVGKLQVWTALYTLLQAAIKTPSLLVTNLGPFLNNDQAKTNGIAEALDSALRAMMFAHGNEEDFRVNVLKPILIGQSMGGTSGIASSILQNIISGWLTPLAFIPTVLRQFTMKRPMFNFIWRPPLVTVRLEQQVDTDIQSMNALIRTTRTPLADIIAFFQVSDQNTASIIQTIIHNHVIGEYKKYRNDLDRAAKVEMNRQNENRGIGRNLKLNTTNFLATPEVSSLSLTDLIAQAKDRL